MSLFAVQNVDIKNKRDFFLLKVEEKRAIDSKFQNCSLNLANQTKSQKQAAEENKKLGDKFQNEDIEQDAYNESVRELQTQRDELTRTKDEFEEAEIILSTIKIEIQTAENDWIETQTKFEDERIEGYDLSPVFADSNIDNGWSDKSLLTDNKILSSKYDGDELRKNQEMIDSHFCLDLNQPLSKVMIKKDVESGVEFPLHGIPYYVEPECDNMSVLISQAYILPIMVDRTHYVIPNSKLPNMLLSARRMFVQLQTVSKQPPDGVNMIFKDHKFITVRKLFVGEEVIIGCDDLDGNKMEHMVKMALLLSCIKEVVSVENLLGSALNVATQIEQYYLPYKPGCTYKNLAKDMRHMSLTVTTLRDLKHKLAFIWFIYVVISDEWDIFFKTHNEADFTSLELLAKEGYPPGISLLANEGFRGRFSFYNYSKGLPVQLDRYAFIQSTIEARQALISAFPILLKRKAIGSEIENATIQCPCCDHQSKHGNARRSYPCPHPALASCKLCAQENELHLNFCEEHMSKHDEHSSAIKMSWQELHERSLSEKSKKYLSEFVDDSEFKITDNCKSVDLAKFIKLKWTCLQKK